MTEVRGWHYLNFSPFPVRLTQCSKQFLNNYRALLVIVTAATTAAATNTTTKKKNRTDMKKANKIKCKQKTPNGKTNSKGVQSGIGRNHKDRQSNKEDCKRKNTSFKCFCDKCKSLPMFATRTVVILPDVESGTTSLSLPDWAKTPRYATAYNNIPLCVPGFHNINASVKRKYLIYPKIRPCIQDEPDTKSSIVNNRTGQSTFCRTVR